MEKIKNNTNLLGAYIKAPSLQRKLIFSPVRLSVGVVKTKRKKEEERFRSNLFICLKELQLYDCQ